MSKDNENTKTLVDLGITRAQARIYLTLLKIGTASAKDVASFSHVARPDTYRAIADLQELGLVEKIISVPALFKPLPIADAVTALLLRRNKESIKLTKRASFLIADLEEKSKKEKPFEDSQLILLPCGDALTIKLRKVLDGTVRQICAIIPRKHVALHLSKNFEIAEKALNRKVTIQLLTEPPNCPCELPEVVELKKSPFFQIRYFDYSAPVCFLIIDGKETLLPKMLQSDHSKPTIIWSNNPCITELAQSYFNNNWNSTQPK